MSEIDESGLTKTEIFVLRCSPVYWLLTAEELKSGCDQFYIDPDDTQVDSFTLTISQYPEPLNNNIPIEKNALSKSFFLLAGFTIENLIKGILIYQNPEFINSGKLSKSIVSHNLVSLAKNILDLDFSNDENNLLKILATAIPYWGRYPAPLIAERLQLEKYLDKDIFNAFTNLYDKLHSTLVDRLTKNGWKSGLSNGFGDINGFKWGTVTEYKFKR